MNKPIPGIEQTNPAATNMSDGTTAPCTANSGRGRGRGRGKKTSTITTRASSAARQLAEANKDKTSQTANNIPGENQTTNTSAPNGTSGVSASTEEQPPVSKDASTTVEEMQIELQPSIVAADAKPRGV
ncbi:uncharacterized protein MELLADRAFT_112930 [Melampsora larici-populina 98AG31]|nr:uncharacterized protein MELLADRAFT_112930 [Melampsora larici-populina 98AG31]EGF99178.1 hypothetical protein MELLADRAFT_112930 [Melampsora larici-populina 98AG31]